MALALIVGKNAKYKNCKEKRRNGVERETNVLQMQKRLKDENNKNAKRVAG